MDSTIRLGRIGGIEVGLHYSWFIIFVVLTVSLAIGFFPANFPQMTTLTTWIVSAASAILLFVAVLIHELSHSFVAQARGMGVQSITLFVFGGVSNIQGEPRSAKDEFLMAVVGPISSFVIGAIFFAVVQLSLPVPVAAVVGYLAIVNVLLAIFNLIPGFPLDGGRVLRSIFWAITKNLRRATIWATAVGQAVAWAFILGGFYIAFFAGALLSGLWLALIGFFLNSAAEANRRQVTVQERFRGARVADLMNPHPVTIGPRASLQEMVERYLLGRNLRALLVTEDDQLLGIITVVDVRDVPPERWPQVSVREVMTPPDRLRVVQPADPLARAVNVLGQGDFHQLPVVSDGRLVGLLSRSEVIRYLQVREELGVEPEQAGEMRRAA